MQEGTYLDSCINIYIQVYVRLGHDPKLGAFVCGQYEKKDRTLKRVLTATAQPTRGNISRSLL